MRNATQDWTAVGKQIKAAREARRPKLSAREAARRADWSNTYWQHLEAGKRPDGGHVNFSDEKLEAAARTVGLDPGPLFALVDRDYTPSPEPPSVPRDELEAIRADVLSVLERVDRLRDSAEQIAPSPDRPHRRKG